MTNFRKIWNLYYRSCNQFNDSCSHVMLFYRLKAAGKA